MSEKFAIDDVGKMTEYLGCVFYRVNSRNEHPSVTLAQPTLVQRFDDEFKPIKCTMTTPIVHMTTLVKPEEHERVSPRQQTMYRSSLGVLIHIARWSRPDVMNAVGKATKDMKASSLAQQRYVNVLISFLS